MDKWNMLHCRPNIALTGGSNPRTRIINTPHYTPLPLIQHKRLPWHCEIMSIQVFNQRLKRRWQFASGHVRVFWWRGSSTVVTSQGAGMNSRALKWVKIAIFRQCNDITHKIQVYNQSIMWILTSSVTLPTLRQASSRMARMPLCGASTRSQMTLLLK